MFDVINRVRYSESCCVVLAIFIDQVEIVPEWSEVLTNRPSKGVDS